MMRRRRRRRRRRRKRRRKHSGVLESVPDPKIVQLSHDSTT